MVQTSEIQEVYYALEGDLQTAAQAFRDNDCSYSRRVLVRNAAALVEGFVNQLASFTLEAIKDLPPRVFTPAEISILKEEGHRLDEKGEVKTTRNHQTLQSRLLYNTNCYLRLFGLTYKIDVGNNGWNSLKKLIKVRHRLMHPKSITDLEVSDVDVQDSSEALNWFGNEAAQVIKMGNDAYYKALDADK